MAPPAIAMSKIDAEGIDAICEAIGDRESMTAIAERLGVSIGSFLNWIEADPERSARVRATRMSMARYWDERCERVIDDATDEFTLKKAKEMSHHYRWRASKIAPKEYGERQVIAGDPEAPLVSTPNDQIDARIAALLGKVSP